MIVVAVPFYVSRPAGEPWREGDALFDHPTPLGGEATLPRLLESLSLLEGQVFRVVVVVAWTHGELAAAAERWARKIAGSWHAPQGIDVRIAGTAMDEWIRRVAGEDEGLADLLDPTRYSGVRNRCLAAALLSGADSLVLLDDDEALRDGQHLSELTGPLYRGWDGCAGLYMEGGERVVVPAVPSAATPHFDANGPRIRAFDALLTHGRPVDAPFAFGGNLALSRRLFEVLPFDPLVARGEDVDYVISARLARHRIRLDPSILVDHHAPPKPQPPWRQLLVDGLRFLAQRRKLDCAERSGWPVLDLDPYPGEVLTADLGRRLARALLALGAPAAALDRLAEWERELAQRDPWREYLARSQTWRDAVGSMERLDGDALLPEVEGR